MQSIELPSIELLTLTLHHQFGLSRGSRKKVQNLFLQIHHGIGEGAPIYYHGQTASDMKKLAASILPGLSQSTDTISELIVSLFIQYPQQSALIQAIDLALHDHVSKENNVPLYHYLGLPKPKEVCTSFTIGLDQKEIMLKKLHEAIEYPILKIKLGTQEDIEILELIWSASQKPIYIDANEGWTLEQAIQYLPKLASLGVQLIEQPFPRDDFDAYQKLRDMNISELPIIIDEGVQSPRDVAKWVGLADGVNVKLAKCGGIYRAMHVIEEAKKYNLKIMLGCMLESSLAISAAAHLCSQVDYVDLDGAALLSNDPYNGIKLNQGIIEMPNRNGIGAVRKITNT